MNLSLRSTLLPDDGIYSLDPPCAVSEHFRLWLDFPEYSTEGRATLNVLKFLRRPVGIPGGFCFALRDGRSQPGKRKVIVQGTIEEASALGADCSVSPTQQPKSSFYNEPPTEGATTINTRGLYRQASEWFLFLCHAHLRVPKHISTPQAKLLLIEDIDFYVANREIHHISLAIFESDTAL